MQFGHPNLLFLLLLFLHVGGAIVAFGPTFALPLIGAAGGREPQHAGFATRLSETIAQQRVTPVAIWVGVTGVLLIIVAGRSLTELWLALAIVLYVFALSFALLVVAPNSRKLVEATNSPPPAAPPGGPPAGAVPGSARPSGPPPQIADLVARSRRYGMVLGMVVTLILLLMIFKPQLG